MYGKAQANSHSSVGSVLVDFAKFRSQYLASQRDGEDLDFEIDAQWYDMLASFYLDQDKEYADELAAVHARFSSAERQRLGHSVEDWQRLLRIAEVRAMWRSFCRLGLVRKSDLPVESFG